MKKKIKGTSSKPRLCVYASNNHIYVQAIDDSRSHTIVACSTLEVDIQAQLGSTKNIEAANLVGQVIGKRMLDKNITTIVFDRNNRVYHGRVKAVAEGARKMGVIF